MDDEDGDKNDDDGNDMVAAVTLRSMARNVRDKLIGRVAFVSPKRIGRAGGESQRERKRERMRLNIAEVFGAIY